MLVYLLLEKVILITRYHFLKTLPPTIEMSNLRKKQKSKQQQKKHDETLPDGFDGNSVYSHRLH